MLHVWPALGQVVESTPSQFSSIPLQGTSAVGAPGDTVQPASPPVQSSEPVRRHAPTPTAQVVFAQLVPQTDWFDAQPQLPAAHDWPPMGQMEPVAGGSSVSASQSSSTALQTSGVAVTAPVHGPHTASPASKG